MGGRRGKSYVNLTANITFDEMTDSAGHPDLVAQNRVDARRFMEPICATARMLQKVRDHYGRAVIVHSGFRNDALDAAVGGVHGQHPKGEAVDFHVEGVDLINVFLWITVESSLPFGQCLLEHRAGKPATWIHLSLGEPWRLHNNRDSKRLQG